MNTEYPHSTFKPSVNAWALSNYFKTIVVYWIKIWEQYVYLQLKQKHSKTLGILDITKY